MNAISLFPLTPSSHRGPVYCTICQSQLGIRQWMAHDRLHILPKRLVPSHSEPGCHSGCGLSCSVLLSSCQGKGLRRTVCIQQSLGLLLPHEIHQSVRVCRIFAEVLTLSSRRRPIPVLLYLATLTAQPVFLLVETRTCMATTAKRGTQYPFLRGDYDEGQTFCCARQECHTVLCGRFAILCRRYAILVEASWLSVSIHHVMIWVCERVSGDAAQAVHLEH